MMKGPYQAIADYMHRRILENLNEVAGRVESKGMSPIEGIFFAALWNISELESPFGCPVVGFEPQEGQLAILGQARIEKFRVDFMVTVRTANGKEYKRLVVECDGHDFHERTKKQAKNDRSRDRRLQELGYTIYRFTGSEIYTNPVKCAQDVLRWADAAAGFPL